MNISNIKIALIEPRVDAECASTEMYYQIRASLPFLAQSLKENGFFTKIFCEEIIHLSSRFHEIARDFNIIGISITINTLERGIEIADRIRSLNNNIKIIFGGHAAGYYAVKLLNHADYVLIGRAEITLPLLIKSIYTKNPSLNDIPNLCTLENKRFIRTKREDLFKDLISDFNSIVNFGLKSELKNIFGLKKPPLYSIFASTGCINHCKFCTSPKNYHTRELDNVISDFNETLKFHKSRKPPIFMLVDDCVFGDIDFLKKLLIKFSEIRKKRKFSILLQFHVKPLIKIPELAPLMKKAGIDMLLIGFESTSDESLKLEGKGTTLRENLEAINICRKNRIIPYGYFVVGLEADTEETVKNVFTFINNEKLIAQVLPMGVNDFDENGKEIHDRPKSLDPYSFGATIFVSHVPKLISPYRLQELIIEGYDKIYSFKEVFYKLTLKEKMYQLFSFFCYIKWRKRLLKHLQLLKKW